MRKEMTHHGIRQHPDPNDTILYVTLWTEWL